VGLPPYIGWDNSIEGPIAVVTPNALRGILCIVVSPGLSDDEVLYGFNAHGWTNYISALGPNSGGGSGVIISMAVSGASLYIGGDFKGFIDGNANYVPATNVAVLNVKNSHWSTFGVGTATPVYSLAVDSNLRVYAGLDERAPSTSCGYPGMLALWDTNSYTWVAVGCGLEPDDYVTPGCGGNIAKVSQPGAITALTASGTDIYVGGCFDRCGDGSTNIHLAKWSGSSQAWSRITADRDWCGFTARSSPHILSIAVLGSTLYVAGDLLPTCNATAPYGLAEFSTAGMGMTSGAGDNLWQHDSFGYPIPAVGRSVRILANCEPFVTGTFDTVGSTDGSSGTAAWGIAHEISGAWGPLTEGSTIGLSFSGNPGTGMFLASGLDTVGQGCVYVMERYFFNSGSTDGFNTAGPVSASEIAIWHPTPP
jgi:hypothetical protein